MKSCTNLAEKTSQARSSSPYWLRHCRFRIRNFPGRTASPDRNFGRRQPGDKLLHLIGARADVDYAGHDDYVHGLPLRGRSASWTAPRNAFFRQLIFISHAVRRLFPARPEPVVENFFEIRPKKCCPEATPRHLISSWFSEAAFRPSGAKSQDPRPANGDFRLPIQIIPINCY